MHKSIHDKDNLDEVDRLLIGFLQLQQHATGASARDLLANLLREEHKLSQPTLSRRLSRLQAMRHVRVKSAGRSTLYVRDPYHDWFSLPPTKRPRVGYDFAVLASYEPNKTQWLTPEDRDRLERAGRHHKMEGSTYSHAIAQKLLVDFSYASSALEGNTYSYLDTQVLIEFGQAAEGKSADETQMILNHKEAVSHLVENVDDIEITSREIRTLHSLLSRGLIDPMSVGAIRARPVDLGGSAYIPLAVPQQITEELETVAAKTRAIDNPFEQSFFLMAMISYLQAFLDVNKRTGRLACNIPLLKNGLAPLSFMEMDKARYVEGLLAFYELKRIDLIKEAFVDCYLASAARYEAYTGRDKGDTEIEIRRRADIQACLKAYVDASISAGRKLDAGQFASKYFSADPADSKVKLVKRIGDVAAALSDANHVAYGISRVAYDAFAQLK